MATTLEQSLKNYPEIRETIVATFLAAKLYNEKGVPFEISREIAEKEGMYLHYPLFKYTLEGLQCSDLKQ